MADIGLPRSKGAGKGVFVRACDLGCEGIVSKRMTGTYGGGTVRDWLKTKRSEIGTFIITG